MRYFQSPLAVDTLSSEKVLTCQCNTITGSFMHADSQKFNYSNAVYRNVYYICDTIRNNWEIFAKFPTPMAIAFTVVITSTFTFVRSEPCCRLLVTFNPYLGKIPFIAAAQ